MGGLWSARGLQVTAALSSRLLTSYPRGSASSPGPGLTEGFCPAVSCARNLPNCRHPRGEERRSGPLLPLQLSPPPPPQPVSAGLTLSLVTRAGARPPQGQADSTVCSCHWPPCPTPGRAQPPCPWIWEHLGHRVCTACLFFSQGPCLLRNTIPAPGAHPGGGRVVSPVPSELWAF